jgi:hypothetical protein
VTKIVTTRPSRFKTKTKNISSSITRTVFSNRLETQELISELSTLCLTSIIFRIRLFSPLLSTRLSTRMKGKILSITIWDSKQLKRIPITTQIQKLGTLKVWFFRKRMFRKCARRILNKTLISLRWREFWIRKISIRDLTSFWKSLLQIMRSQTVKYFLGASNKDLRRTWTSEIFSTSYQRKKFLKLQPSQL